MLWLEIFTGVKPWLLFLGYRQWRTLNPKTAKTSGDDKKQMERLKKWQTSWTKAEQEDKPLLILGDMNIGVTTWLNPASTETAYQYSRKTFLNQLKDMANMTNLELLKTGPTRQQGKAQPSTLDLSFTNMPQLISSPELYTSTSDHSIIVLNKTSKWKQGNLPVRKGRS